MVPVFSCYSNSRGWSQDQLTPSPLLVEIAAPQASWRARRMYLLLLETPCSGNCGFGGLASWWGVGLLKSPRFVGPLESQAFSNLLSPDLNRTGNFPLRYLTIRNCRIIAERFCKEINMLKELQKKYGTYCCNENKVILKQRQQQKESH